MKFLPLFLLTASLAYSDVPSKGVELFYLDGLSQDVYVILDNLSDPTYSARLESVLDGYKAASVNLVRVLIVSDFDPRNFPHATVSRLANYNELIRRCRSRGMRMELLFIGSLMNTAATDYTVDEAWMADYLSNLTLTHDDLVTIGGDTAFCGFSTTGENRLACYPDADTPAGWMNQGRWVVTISAWANKTYPHLRFTAETWIGFGDPDGSSGEISRRVSKLFDEQLPLSPYTAGPVYYNLPAGSTWQEYASLFSRTIYRFHSFSNRPVWFDEYGAPKIDEPNRSAYLRGFLTATGCAPDGYVAGEATWVGGNDGGIFGYIDKFVGNVAQWDADWSVISKHYSAEQCNPPSITAGGVVPMAGVYPVWLAGSGISPTSSIELYDADGSLWGVNIVPLVVSSGFLTFSLPGNLAPSKCNATQPCTVQAVVVSDGSPSQPFPLILPAQGGAPIKITAAGVVYSFHPPVVWVAASNVTPSSKLFVNGTQQPFALNGGIQSFTLQSTSPCSFYYVDAGGMTSNTFTVGP